MPRSIARQRTPKNRIAGRSLAARYGLANLQAPYSFPPGSYSLVIPKSGYWLFVGWSAGSKLGATYTGCSGAYGEITKALLAGQIISISVGPEDSTGALANTVLTFPDGAVATLTNASADTPGAATGQWDYSLAGSLGGLTSTSANGSAGSGTGGGVGGVGSGGIAGGAGAPGRLPFRGGRGGGFRIGLGNFTRAMSPGGGGCDSTTNDADVAGVGAVIAFLVRE